MKTYGLGRRPAVDDRDQLFPFSLALEQIPIKQRKRPYRIGRILNQNGFPHCVGYSWKQWMQSAPTMTQHGPNADQLYDIAQENDEWDGKDYDGSSVRGGIKGLVKLGHAKSYVWARQATEIISGLKSNLGLCVVGTDWTADMFAPDAKGVVRPTGSIAGGHAYVVRWWQPAEGLFECLNSWGEGWGQKGKFYIPTLDLDRLIREGGEACFATEVKVKPIG